MRAVLDPNVLIAALLSADGAPAQLLGRWLGGELELVVSEALLVELERALAFPKLSTRVTPDDASGFSLLLRRSMRLVPDPPHPARRSSDPGDDYLLALAESARAVLVSGDRHVLALADRFPVRTPRAFLDELAGR